ncbi:hypothetical protein AB0O14_19215 [Microbacterium foliorum]|uniref:hypothetical protein n=1 Tax=Rothia terrae TaxID=396015 RepID=UPI003443652D
MTTTITTGTILHTDPTHHKPLQFFQVTRKAKTTVWLRALPLRHHTPNTYTPNLTKPTPVTAQGTALSEWVSLANHQGYLTPWDGAPITTP